MKYDSTGSIQDAYRFILATKQTIESFPLQIHPSALLICPITSRIRQQSLEDPATFFEMKHGMQTGWDSCVQAIDVGLVFGHCIAISPDGKLFASMSMQGPTIWDIATGIRLKTLKNPYEELASPDDPSGYLLFSPNGQHLATCKEKSPGIIIWDISSGEVIQNLPSYTHWGCNLLFSPDWKHLVSGSDDGTIIIWDIASGRCIRTLENTDKIVSVSFNSNGKSLVSCSIGGTIKIWDDTGKCLHEHTLEKAWESASDAYQRIWFSPDSYLLAFVDLNGKVKILDLGSFQYTKPIQWSRYIYGITCLVLLPNNRQLVVAAETFGELNNCIIIWDIDANKVLKALTGHHNEVTCIEVSPDGSRLISASPLDRTIRMWDIDPEVDDSMIWEEREYYDLPMAFSTDGNKFASISRDNTIKVLDTATSGHVQTLSGHQTIIRCIAISSDGKLLASGSADKNVKIWDIANNVCIQTLEGHTDWISLVKFLPDCQRLASASEDSTIRIWDLSAACSLTLEDCNYQHLTPIDLTKDGRILVSSCEDGTVKVWETFSGKCIQTLRLNHVWKPINTAISPEGKTLASSSGYDLKIWREIDGQYKCVQTLEQHDRFDAKVTFSPDGRQLIYRGFIAATTTNVWNFGNLTSSATTCQTLQCDQSSFLTSKFSETGNPVVSELCLYGLDITECWITRDGHKILCLPDDIRPESRRIHERKFTVHGRTVAILGGNRRIVMLAF